MKAIWAEKLCYEINDSKWCYTEMNVQKSIKYDNKLEASIRLYFREDAIITEFTINKIKKVARNHGFKFVSINFCPIEQTPYILLWKKNKKKVLQMGHFSKIFPLFARIVHFFIHLIIK